ncbi:hypothetical protein P171DRAFT_65418 [Karstenula rhodostoma CBS 690.94]|uniref:Uncharacterized protein n=1 Tax=Karstenula rhodostoma CBS 690.94 TaxID=1392251 RepID=A0A9P4U8H8_9PLEO|nr:hypothetical protein P171DRAFT_65418 [Karstenula rhodostoma CBS 690.94]
MMLTSDVANKKGHSIVCDQRDYVVTGGIVGTARLESKYMHPCRGKQSNSWAHLKPLSCRASATCVQFTHLSQARSTAQPRSTPSAISARTRDFAWQKEDQVVGCELPSISVSGVPWSYTVAQANRARKLVSSNTDGAVPG